MKIHKMILLLGICLIGIPGVSDAALDWQIRWSDLESPQIAKVYIFNPEFTRQTFALEIGDIAKTSNIDPNAPYLILGQDVSLRIQPGERKIFDVLVYQDIDPYNTYASQETQTYTLSAENYRILLEGRPSSGDSRQSQYPIDSRGINPVPRLTPEENEYSYRNERGYWKLLLVDHDHVAEQLIRTGNRLGAAHNSIQQAILFYTQGNMALNSEAKTVWDAAFPELIGTQPPPLPSGPCTYHVTLVTDNLSQYSSSKSVMVGDVLGPKDQGFSPVVAAQDVSYSVSPETAGSKRLLQVFPMKKAGMPYETSEYASIINHDSQIERFIRIGIAESYDYCAIQDVVWYLNEEVSSVTIGKTLWERVEGEGPTPPSTRRSCFGGGQTANVAELDAAPENWKNLAVLVGMVLPFGVIFRRKGRK